MIEITHISYLQRGQQKKTVPVTVPTFLEEKDLDGFRKCKQRQKEIEDKLPEGTITVALQRKDLTRKEKK
jgi:RNA polymerase-interacting CarD/CdnL/TRCF family regulator